MKQLYIFILASLMSANAIAQQLSNDTIPATFRNGVEDWAKYLTDNLKSELGAKYVKIPKGQKSASETVIVSFLVTTKGFITEITVENPKEVHPKLANEAVRILTESPRWKPATVNSKPVFYLHRQSITFSCNKED